MKHYTFALALLLAATGPLHAQQNSLPRQGLASIETVSGATYYGSIVRESPDTVFLKTEDNASVELLRNTIASINYEATKLPNHYWAVGGVLGTPAGGNFVVGSYWEHLGVRLSFGYWGDALAGFELSLPINLYRSEHTSHDIALVLLYTQIGTTEQDFDWNTGLPYNYTFERTFAGIGPAYQVNLSGFSGELGLTFGSGDFSNPELIFQLGYVYEFR
ncbi:MAG TPA: hypothetical protein VG537_11680 [Candidatus Kapabacteria bacterium]|jgi:hypothetical protein|nr:hypothetical protein [Candidatus Kapabacteria bacterium]